jgi:hypothetical protein
VSQGLCLKACVSRLVSQGLHALFCGTLHPLAYCSFGDPQSVGYVRLFVALFLQLQGA